MWYWSADTLFSQLTELNKTWLSNIKRYSPTSIKRPPIFLPLNCCIQNLYSTATSKMHQRPPFLLLQSYYMFLFISIKRPANYLFKQNCDRKPIIWTRALRWPCTSPIDLTMFSRFKVASHIYLKHKWLFSCRYNSAPVVRYRVNKIVTLTDISKKSVYYHY